jgi:glyoxylase-like metal-dependent hydrolase (beta-lactamase superfamily II)
MIAIFQRWFLLVLALAVTACSIPDAEQESEMLDGVRRYAVKVEMGNSLMTENMYLVFDPQTRNAVIIDPGAQSKKMENFIEAQHLKILLVLNTHGHFDHVSANQHYRELYHVPVAAHQADAGFFVQSNESCRPDRFFSTADDLGVPLNIKIIYTPGHSEGSVCYLIHNRLFSGDTLFHGSIGRIWGATEAEENGKTAALIQTIKAKLLVLPENTLVFPGHGELTDISHEKQYNPFLK